MKLTSQFQIELFPKSFICQDSYQNGGIIGTRSGESQKYWICSNGHKRPKIYKIRSCNEPYSVRKSPTFQNPARTSRTTCKPLARPDFDNIHFVSACSHQKQKTLVFNLSMERTYPTINTPSRHHRRLPPSLSDDVTVDEADDSSSDNQTYQYTSRQPRKSLASRRGSNNPTRATRSPVKESWSKREGQLTINKGLKSIYLPSEKSYHSARGDFQAGKLNYIFANFSAVNISPYIHKQHWYQHNLFPNIDSVVDYS